MKKRLLFFYFIICTMNIHGMKRARGYHTIKNGSHKKTYVSPSTITIIPDNPPLLFDMGSLPHDLQNSIVGKASKYPNAPTPKAAIEIFRCFALVNQYWSKQMNCLAYSDEIIDNIAHRYICSHETVARYLNTPAALQRLDLQHRLKHLCFWGSNNETTASRLQSLIERGCNLNFIHNYRSAQGTALMISLDATSGIHKLFLKTGANINAGTTYGQTPLMNSVKFPVQYDLCDELLKDPLLDLNKQNRRGETALLCALRYRKPSTFSTPFAGLIQKLLKSGADPELPDKNGVTPLEIAFDHQSYTIINLLYAAIQKKYSSIALQQSPHSDK